MLHYLWSVPQELFITLTVITLLLGCVKVFDGRRGEAVEFAGIGLGLVLATGRALMHAIRSTRDVQINLYVFYVGILAMLATLLLALLGLRKDAPGGLRLLFDIAAAVTSADLLLYKSWKIIWAPAEFDTAGKGWLSAEFFLRLAGFALALILLAVYCRCLYKCTLRVVEDARLWNGKNGEATGRSGHGLIRRVVALEALAVGIIYYGQILRTWRTHKPWRLSFVPEMPFERDLSMFVGNNIPLLIGVVGSIALIVPAVLFARSLALRGLWSNPAQQRRLKANNRHNRRWAVIVLACLVLSILNVTVVYAVDNREVEPPSSEEWEVSEDGTQVLIPVEQVNDYNLHAFEMKTENGVTVRWIIIRKPNSAAYGVGLDACDVCGTAGYYQRGETVVCKKCDVVMNTNTIGLAGGCNPVPLTFKVDGGSIVIPMDELLAAEKRFK